MLLLQPTSLCMLLFTMLSVACHSKQSSDQQYTAIAPAGSDDDETRFSHRLHTGDRPEILAYKNRGLACEDCHSKEAVLAGESARPGANQHAPCDECHAEEFYKAPGKFCQNCHVSVDPTVRGKGTMRSYPERGFRKVFAAEFSHRLHLDEKGMEAAVGFHVTCSDCHKRDPKTKDPTLPGHKQCAQCHAEKATARNALSMGNCENCHKSRDQELIRGRVFITGDLIFAHDKHEDDLGGKAIPCETCHTDVAASTASSQVSVPRKRRCATCHEDASKTPDSVRIDNCEVCHEKIKAGPKPSSHSVESVGLPIDHTVEFRKNHGEQAAQENAPCAFCHQEISGSKRDNCFACHQTKLPRDHNLGWRDDSHGREAVIDRERCVTCHTADYCTACHSVTPRSHLPFSEFRLGGHARAARFDLRTCLSCHTFEDTCSNCHRSRR